MGFFGWLKSLFKEEPPKSPLEWTEKRKEVVEAVAFHEKRSQELLERAKVDKSFRSEYYKERLAHLENKSVSVAARLFWLTRLKPEQKQDYVKRFLDLLQDLSTIEDPNVRKLREVEFRKLEDEIENMLKLDAERIRIEHAKYLK